MTGCKIAVHGLVGRAVWMLKLILCLPHTRPLSLLFVKYMVEAYAFIKYWQNSIYSSAGKGEVRRQRVQISPGIIITLSGIGLICNVSSNLDVFRGGLDLPTVRTLLKINTPSLSTPRCTYGLKLLSYLKCTRRFLQITPCGLRCCFPGINLLTICAVTVGDGIPSKGSVGNDPHAKFPHGPMDSFDIQGGGASTRPGRQRPSPAVSRPE